MSYRDETEPPPAWRTVDGARNIYEHMEAIRSHLRLWIGERTIHNLVLYLGGYEGALWVHRIEERDCPPSQLFMAWLEKTRPIPPERGLDDELLHQAQGDNELALDHFFKLFAEFGRYRSVLGEFVDIPRGHMGTTLAGLTHPMLKRIQLGFLEPAKWCFVKEWIADRVRYSNYLYDDDRAAKKAVESQYGLSPGGWLPASMLGDGDR